MQQVPEIPNFISDELLDLLKSLINGTCIFLGAGVSKLAGYRKWDELCRELINRFWKHKEKFMKNVEDFSYSIKERLEIKSYNEPIDVMDFLYSLDKDFFEKSIVNIFEEDKRQENLTIFKNFSALFNIPENFFIQTNIDTAFQRYFNIKEQDIEINPRFSFTSKYKKLYYLHGVLNRKDSWIFTTAQYNNNYLNERSNVFKFLVKIFKKYTVLFIGYSLRDFEIRQAISKSKLEGSTKTHYILVPYKESIKDKLIIDQSKFLNYFNIKFILFNIERSGYEQLLNVLQELNNIINKMEVKW